jgi:phosphoribosylformylglycinamidine synthase
VGGTLDRIALLDNFCWGNPDKPDRLGSMVRAALGCYKIALGYEVPFISGKDSLNNEYILKKESISIPGSLLISAIGIIDDIKKTVSMDFKKPGNLVYIVGATFNEMGGSVYLDTYGELGGTVPRVDTKQGRQIFQALTQATAYGLIASMHDCSDGGIAVALAECCFGPEPIGAHIILTDFGERHDMALFNERQNRIIISCEPKYVNPIIHICFDCRVDVHVIGWTGGDSLRVTHNDELVIDQDIRYIKTVWESALQ